jgi:hypothetical protein
MDTVCVRSVRMPQWDDSAGVCKLINCKPSAAKIIRIRTVAQEAFNLEVKLKVILPNIFCRLSFFITFYSENFLRSEENPKSTLPISIDGYDSNIHNICTCANPFLYDRCDHEEKREIVGGAPW